MNYLKQLVCFLTLLITSITYSQDTIFVRSLQIESIAKNIDTDGTSLYIRLKKELYKWEDGKLKHVSEGKLKYSLVTYDNEQNTAVINHTNSIPTLTKSILKDIDNIIPGSSNKLTSIATIGNSIFICNKGVVLEFKIIPYFRRIHNSVSIRHIYTEPDLRVISSYSGLFFDTNWEEFSTNKQPGVILSYSNGEFTKIDSLHYLCQDNLISYNKKEGTFKTIINTENKPRFRKLIKFKDVIYGLYKSAFGPIDLKRGKCLEYLITDELTDCIVFKNKLFVSSANSTLYELDTNGVIITHTSKSPINNLVIINDKIHIGTNNGLYTFENGKFNEVIPKHEIIEALSFQNKIIFSNNTGLFYHDNNNVVPLIPNIEFNKMALHIDEHYLYAGSVEGLFVIEIRDLIKATSQQIKINSNNNKSIFKFSLPIIIISIVFLGLILFLLFNFILKKDRKISFKSKTYYDSELIKKVILKNNTIISVEGVAEVLNTSVVQINRHLKKEDTTCLKVIKEVKKEIALEMYKKGISLDLITKRVGYSERYIKENFLRN